MTDEHVQRFPRRIVMPVLLPPAGAPIRLAAFTQCRQVAFPCYSSGTAALAAVLVALAQKEGGKRREVVIPAYGCPALVAAIRYAELDVVLADVGPESPFVSMKEWRRNVTSRTLAVVPINFLGLEPVGFQGVDQGVTYPWPATVYDCCQGWPTHGRCPDWAAATVVSFGRGKPITLGRGGAVLLNARAPSTLKLPEGKSRQAPKLFRLRATLYNWALSPRIYWWLDKLPFLSLGKTEYRPLSDIGAIPKEFTRHLVVNIEAFHRTKGWTVSDVESASGLRDIGAYRVLPALSEVAGATRLLRLPILAASFDGREAAVKALRRRGYGATAMYRDPLWKVRGLEYLRRYEPVCSGAQHFADRLLTLPLHHQVSNWHLEEMAECLSRIDK